jgi:uncharacterized membrane protein (UPF0127 family)
MAYISKTKKILISFFLFFFLILLSIMIFYKINYSNLEEKGFSHNSYNDGDIITIEIRDENNNFKKELEVELALSPQAHYQGLSNREGILKSDGMLFVFKNSSSRSFVMRNMNFNLDIIFINDNKILNIEKNLEPEGRNYEDKYSSIGISDMVLEVEGEYSDKNNIERGDIILINGN